MLPLLAFIGAYLFVEHEDLDAPLEVTLGEYLCMRCSRWHMEGRNLYQEHLPHCFKMRDLNPYEGILRVYARTVEGYEL